MADEYGKASTWMKEAADKDFATAYVAMREPKNSAASKALTGAVCVGAGLGTAAGINWLNDLCSSRWHGDVKMKKLFEDELKNRPHLPTGLKELKKFIEKPAAKTGAARSFSFTS